MWKRSITKYECFTFICSANKRGSRKARSCEFRLGNFKRGSGSRPTRRFIILRDRHSPDSLCRYVGPINGPPINVDSASIPSTNGSFDDHFGPIVSQTIFNRIESLLTSSIKFFGNKLSAIFVR